MHCINAAIFQLLLLVSICFSCQQATNSEAADVALDTVQANETTKQMDVEGPLVESKKEASVNKEDDPELHQAQAEVLSVREELIMPADYLTTVMKVRTAQGDTLTFTDAEGLESLAGKEITLKYRLIPQAKWLVCRECMAFDEKVKLADITSVASEVQFEKLKLRQFIEDPYIETASTFMMENAQGQVEGFLSAKYDLANDSVKMKLSFYNYGFVNAFHPELVNRAELEALSK
ncbi:hypothetical protein GCM10009122_25330 [Fulvivirga kasyanovii]|uniref:DUF4292 domain-containing protein n=1 Tax=Fulvivirga kasyanovii TaxID=396812 RepID=A0ABW9RQ91_9BACT|nr:hypothetical protein [Fulvivirga kasyanovii]MTI25125.1 hypothetical protein [Fulvivirga kasyanovii]